MAGNKHSEKESKTVRAQVNPGICGFPCVIEAISGTNRTAMIKIIGSECKQVQQMGLLFETITMPQLFAPVSRNPIFVAAEKSGCHASCIVPAAILKTLEITMGMALPKAAGVTFDA
jgi:hypothetical protein